LAVLYSLVISTRLNTRILFLTKRLPSQKEIVYKVKIAER